MASRLHEFIDEAADILRYDGVGVLLWTWLVAALSPVCRIGIEHVFSHDLTQPLEPRRAKVPLQIRHGTPDDAEALVAMEHGVPLPDDGSLDDEEEYREDARAMTRARFLFQYRREMGLGERCFIATTDGEIAHMNWTRFLRATPFPGCTFPLRRGEEVFCSDGYTPARWRGKSVHGEVNMHMLIEAAASGHRVAYTMTDLVKTRSRRGLYRLGWRREGTLLYLIPRGLGRTFVMRLAGSLGPITRSP